MSSRFPGEQTANSEGWSSGRGREEAARSTSPRKKISFRPFAEFLVVGICTLMFSLTAVGILGSLFGKNAAGTRDFVEYWASGKQLAHRADPYDVGSITQLERSVGFPPEVPAMVMANPPSALVAGLSAGFSGCNGCGVVVASAVADQSGHFGKNRLEVARQSQESRASPRLFVCTGALLHLVRTGDDLHTSWLGLVSEISSVQSIFRWSFFVALHVEAAPLRAVWRGADPVGHPYPKL